MAVWEHSELSFAETFFRSIMRTVAVVVFFAVIIGPILAGGWVANLYIDHRTNTDGLKLSIVKKDIPSPTELINEAVSDVVSMR